MLKTIYATATAGLFLALAAGAAADPWKDESGNGRQGYERYDESYTEDKEDKIERSENGCKIEEKFDGGYKKEVNCDGRSARIGSGLPQSYGPPVNLVPEEMTPWPKVIRRSAVSLSRCAGTCRSFSQVDPASCTAPA